MQQGCWRLRYDNMVLAAVETRRCSLCLSCQTMKIGIMWSQIFQHSNQVTGQRGYSNEHDPTVYTHSVIVVECFREGGI